MKDSGVTQSGSKCQSAAMFDRKAGHSGVLYKNKEYESATDALEAYMLDYDQKQKKYYTKDKYEKEVLDLLCPKVKTNTNSWLDHGKAETESTISRIVRESYQKLEEADRETVRSSLSASMKLMKRLENDRLPSPTRSMQPGGRPSAGSTDTETLLDARPTGTGLLTSDVTKSRDFSTHKSGGGPVDSPNPLLASQPRAYWTNSDGRTASGYSSKDSLPRSDPWSASGQYSHNGMNTSTHLTKERDHMEHLATNLQQQQSFQKPDVSLSRSDERYRAHDTERTGTTVVDETLRRINKLEERANRSLLSDSKLQDRTGARNSTTQNLSGLSTKDSVAMGGVRGKAMADVSMKSQTSTGGYMGDGNRRPGKANKHGFGKNPQGSYIDMASGAESDGTSSSIITGHMMKGALPHKPGLIKVSSTPKREVREDNIGTKQLRFDLETSKSSIGQGLQLHDLNTRHSKPAAHSAELQGSFDLSKVHTGTPVKTSFVGGGNVGILKTMSPGKTRGAMSRVSFTTDDLLTCDPSGFAPPDRKPRSNSLPRPSNGHLTLLDKSDMHVLRNPFDTPLDTSMDRYSKYSKREDSRVSKNDTSLRDIKEAKYKEFLKGLMRDIDDSASSVGTLGEGLRQSPNAEVHSATGQGGYLERIQKLLSGVPTVSEFLTSDDTQDSLTTEAVLEGDRPWEKLPAFKLPQPVSSSNNGVDVGSKNMFEEFMADCMAEAGSQPGIPGGDMSQPPGPLEALKNMLFTVQSLGTSVKEETTSPVEGSENGELVDLPLNDSISKLLSPETKKLLSTSYSQGAPSLTKAMEHLTKLKDLVHFTPDEQEMVAENQEDDYDII